MKEFVVTFRTDKQFLFIFTSPNAALGILIRCVKHLRTLFVSVIHPTVLFYSQHLPVKFCKQLLVASKVGQLEDSLNLGDGNTPRAKGELCASRQGTDDIKFLFAANTNLTKSRSSAPPPPPRPHLWRHEEVYVESLLRATSCRRSSPRTTEGL